MLSHLVFTAFFVGMSMADGILPHPHHPPPFHRPAPYGPPAPVYHPEPAPFHPPQPYLPKPAPYHPPAFHEEEYKLPPRPFNYEYGVHDEYSGASFSKSENQDNYGVVSGEYRVALPDGRTQIVTYHADHENGYVADVKYEGEPRYEPYHPSPAPYRPSPAPYHPAPAPVYRPTPPPYNLAPIHG